MHSGCLYEYLHPTCNVQPRLHQHDPFKPASDRSEAAASPSPRCAAHSAKQRRILPDTRPPEKVRCSICGSILKDAASLKNHTVRQHLDKRLWQCPYCQKTCKRKEGTERHVAKWCKKAAALAPGVRLPPIVLEDLQNNHDLERFERERKAPEPETPQKISFPLSPITNTTSSSPDIPLSRLVMSKIPPQPDHHIVPLRFTTVEAEGVNPAGHLRPLAEYQSQDVFGPPIRLLDPHPTANYPFSQNYFLLSEDRVEALQCVLDEVEVERLLAGL